MSYNYNQNTIELALLPALQRFIRAKQKAFKEVQDVAERYGIPVENATAWFLDKAAVNYRAVAGSPFLVSRASIQEQKRCMSSAQTQTL